MKGCCDSIDSIDSIEGVVREGHVLESQSALAMVRCVRAMPTGARVTRIAYHEIAFNKFNFIFHAIFLSKSPGLVDLVPIVVDSYHLAVDKSCNCFR